MEDMEETPMVRKRRAGHGDHDDEHHDDEHPDESMPEMDHDEEDMHHEEHDEFPMSYEDVEQYLKFEEEGNSISKFYYMHGEWLQQQWESMSPEEMAQASDYMMFVGSFLNDETRAIHQYIMPYLDHMQYKFCF